MAAKRESRAPEEPLDSALAAFIASDEELRAQVRAVLVDMLNEFRYMLKFGSPPVKAKMLSTLGTAMVRGTTVRAEADEDEVKRRVEFERAMAEARQEIEAKDVVPVPLTEVADG